MDEWQQHRTAIDQEWRVLLWLETLKRKKMRSNLGKATFS